LTTPDKNARRFSTKRHTIGVRGFRAELKAHAFWAVVHGVFILLVTMILTTGTATRAADTITWEAYDKAILRIDGDPPKVWGLYHSTKGKKDEVLLLLWNKRYLMLNTHLKEVRELDPQTITYKTHRLESPGDDKTATILPSTEWIVRDVGSAFRIRTILTEEKHEIEINLPH
jgi:hypothetical protein